MKKFKFFLTIALLATLQSNLFAQREQTSTIKNVAIDACNSKLSFDIWSRSTGATTNISVGVSSFLVNINASALGTPVLSNVNSKYNTSNGFNDFSARGVAYNEMGVQITSGKVNVSIYYTGDNFGSSSLSTSSPDGERICTITLNITNHNATTDLTWDVVNSSITLSNSAALAKETWTGNISSLNLDIKLWTGTSSADWATAGNWCPSGVPSTGDSVVIPVVPNQPILSASSTIGSFYSASSTTVNLNGNSLTMSGNHSFGATFTGSSTSSLAITETLGTALTLTMSQTTPGTTNVLQNLTVNRSGGLTLSNALRITGILTPTAGTITTGGNLTLAASGTGTYSQIAGTGSGTISGNVVMEKFLSNTTAGWRQFALPLVGNLGGFANIDLLYSSHTPTNERNVFHWDATLLNGNATGWTASASTDNQTRGYSIYSNTSSGGLQDISQTISYTGTYDKSDRSYAIKATIDASGSGTSATGWNFIGNPYPSNYDLTQLFTNWPGSVSYKAVHVWDAPGGQYIAQLGSGASIVNYNTSGGTGSSTVLAPFQGFWVKANSDVSFTVSNSYRTTSATGLGTFLKKEFDLARLDVYDADSAWDQTVVYFTEEGSTGFDNGFDGYKLVSIDPNVPSLYSTSPEGIFSISALSSDNFTHTVPLGFRSTKKGKMSFALNTAELDDKWYVYLEDKELGIFYDIKENPYTFNHTQNSDSRFVLHFQTYGLSNGKLVDNIESMKISGDGNEVFVFVPPHYHGQNYHVTVFDFAGKLVHESKNVSLQSGMNTLNFPLNQSAYYIVRIEAAEGLSSGKVYLR